MPQLLQGRTTRVNPTGFLHMVYFYLHDENDAVKLAQGCREYLTDIPGVRRLDVGVPAGTPRAVVDNAYGVALLVEFADKEAHDVYQDHSDHHRFIEACSPFWSRVQVFDSLLGAG
jgi:hypothetical protein